MYYSICMSSGFIFPDHVILSAVSLVSGEHITVSLHTVTSVL